jgi:hypothetical protein
MNGVRESPRRYPSSLTESSTRAKGNRFANGSCKERKDPFFNPRKGKGAVRTGRAVENALAENLDGANKKIIFYIIS